MLFVIERLLKDTHKATKKWANEIEIGSGLSLYSFNTSEFRNI